MALKSTIQLLHMSENIHDLKYLSRILHYLSLQRENNVFCDLIIVSSEGTRFSVHRSVLCAASVFVESLISFETDLSEYNAEHITPHTMELKNLSDQELTQIIDYLYKGELNVLDEEIPSLLVAADYLQMMCLTEVCLKRAHQLLKADTFLPFWLIGQRCAALEPLKMSSHKWATRYICQLLREPLFSGLPDIYEEELKRLITSPSVIIEYCQAFLTGIEFKNTLLSLVQTWAMATEECRLTDDAEIMNLIQKTHYDFIAPDRVYVYPILSLYICPVATSESAERFNFCSDCPPDKWRLSAITIYMRPGDRACLTCISYEYRSIWDNDVTKILAPAQIPPGSEVALQVSLSHQECVTKIRLHHIRLANSLPAYGGVYIRTNHGRAHSCGVTSLASDDIDDNNVTIVGLAKMREEICCTASYFHGFEWVLHWGVIVQLGTIWACLHEPVAFHHFGSAPFVTQPEARKRMKRMRQETNF